MEAQTLLNISLGLISGSLGFFIRLLWDAVKDLQEADKQIVDKVNEMEVLVAGNYVKRSELQDFSKIISEKLDKVLDN